MLSQINGFPLHFPILSTMFKSLLPFITKNEEWTRYMSQLSKVKNVFLIIQNKLTKLKEGENKCPICDKFIFQRNLFVLILHIEIQHQFLTNKRYYMISGYDNELVVKKYQFTYDGLEIYLVKISSMIEQGKKQGSKRSQKFSNTSVQNQLSFKQYLVETKSVTFLQSSLKMRNMALLERIFSKFSKRLQTISTERRYYHSYNIYQTIGPDSENSDQKRQQSVEKQLQRLRINDFSDVSYWDKYLFLEWNNLLRKQKKELKILDNIVQVVQKFVRLCKEKKIPKINLNMHLYTLWSVGRITNIDIVELLQTYEFYEPSESLQNISKP